MTYGTAIEGLLEVAPGPAFAILGLAALMFALGMNQTQDGGEAKSKTVVLIDDDADILRGMRYLIETHTPFRVAGVAYSGVEGLRVVEAVGPDLVVIDVKLPELGGIQTARRLRESNPNLPLIAYSSSDDDATGKIMRRAGASAQLVKGDDPGTIVRTIMDFA